jgi:hypothetical protein
MANVAINGLGRIGRATFKILLDTPDLDLIAVNDVATAENLLYLLRYDSVYGRYDKSVTLEGNSLVVDDFNAIHLFQELGIDLVFECKDLSNISRPAPKPPSSPHHQKARNSSPWFTAQARMKHRRQLFPAPVARHQLHHTRSRNHAPQNWSEKSVADHRSRLHFQSKPR